MPRLRVENEVGEWAYRGSRIRLNSSEIGCKFINYSVCLSARLLLLLLLLLCSFSPFIKRTQHSTHAYNRNQSARERCSSRDGRDAAEDARKTKSMSNSMQCSFCFSLCHTRLLLQQLKKEKQQQKQKLCLRLKLANERCSALNLI